MSSPEVSERGSERAERGRLLDLAADYVLEFGVSSATLRGLSRALGSNNRMLLYYFGSKAGLLLEALRRAGLRFPGITHLLDLIRDSEIPIADRLHDAWGILADPELVAYHRLFFELFGVAAFDSEQYRPLLEGVANEWADETARAIAETGVDAELAETLGHEIVAAWRGFQMTLIGGGDRAVVDRAARHLTESIVANVYSAARPIT
ncbi:TetR/AcrR family transcriptional regulator [Rhodococcus erythropolis]|uniref:TetR/AcrR family transcriptional regulator n=1 Tax=Rhodococcus erythropolis TaxID=1833 RepID=UPI001E43D76D|nr:MULTISPECIES: TetR/AcrR family transcriptional regulator [Rhodococcus erythropolis group]MCD2107470.1 TetR/AcrR family transcriptional regulator [Rhodococcus qingshengii]MCZ4526833.1 TetR/AcrR family transcriptional regulator [Rhodococcus erythropolis]